jgi:hypothetical protein
MLFRKFAARGTAVLALAGMLGACATAPGGSTSAPSASNRAAVIARADARGALLVRGDLDAAYAYLSEGSKAVISLDNFKRRMSLVVFTAYRVDDATCDAESCKVQAKMTYDHRVMKGVTTPVTETWIVERGGLYFVFPPI